MLTLDREFVQRWCNRYNEIFRGSYDETEEKAIRSWLSIQTGPKYLNKECFVRLGRWKTKRQTSNYQLNDENTIIQVTRCAYQANDALIKLSILKTLRGVGVAVAGTILHYLHPDRFPIFDYHARATLKRANLWSRDVNDDSDQAWLEYIKTMNELAKRLGVSLRDLDKALFAYDKYGPRN